MILPHCFIGPMPRRGKEGYARIFLARYCRFKEASYACARGAPLEYRCYIVPVDDESRGEAALIGARYYGDGRDGYEDASATALRREFHHGVACCKISLRLSVR